MGIDGAFVAIVTSRRSLRNLLTLVIISKLTHRQLRVILALIISFDVAEGSHSILLSSLKQIGPGETLLPHQQPREVPSLFPHSFPIHLLLLLFVNKLLLLSVKRHRNLLLILTAI